jgi:uncharacterized protein YndB with AHSA1/START domain
MGEDVSVSSMRISRHIDAPRERIYAALIDPVAITQWKVPTEMTGRVHSFEAREGGTFRISLTYDQPDRVGKTTDHTDTYRGRFVRLVLNETVVEIDEFETDDPDLHGEMTITYTLTDADGGTDLIATHEGLPPGVAPADNELGWHEALNRLSVLVEIES